MTYNNLGIIGIGTIGQEHCLVAQDLGAQIISASASSTSGNWRQFKEIFPNAQFHSDPFELIDDPKIEAIIVCPSWDVIPSWLSHLLRHPKPMLIEKPIALRKSTLEDALNHQSPETLKMIGFNRRFYSTVQRLSERMKHGGLISAQITYSENVSRLKEKYGPAIVPHLLSYSTSHILDVALLLFGSLRIMRSYKHHETKTVNSFVGYSALLETENKCPVWLSIQADDPTPIGIKCRFDDHTVWNLQPLERLTVFQGIEVKEVNENNKIRRFEPRVIETIGAADKTRFKPGFYNQMRAFLSNDQTVCARPEDSLHVITLIESLETMANTPIYSLGE
jgi:predicted dehydrogenase